MNTHARHRARFLRWKRAVPLLRYPMLAGVHAARPLLWLWYQTPLASPIFCAAGRRIDLGRTKGNSFAGYTPGAGDVVVCSYGKSGTNWAMQMVMQIAHRGAAEFGHIHDVVPWPDCPGPGYAIPPEDPAPRAASPTGMRPIKTHLPWKHVPYSPEAKYLCVVRDPKDVVVSGYHFFKSVGLGPLMPPVSVWVDYMLTEESFLGSWTEHLHGYWDQRHRDNVLFMAFEEMKADQSAAVDRLAALMGVELSETQRAAVIHKSSFSYMQSVDHQFYPGLISPLGSPHGRMMREGKSNGASALLSPAQEARIDAHYREALRARGCDFPYDALFCHSNQA